VRLLGRHRKKYGETVHGHAVCHSEGAIFAGAKRRLKNLARVSITTGLVVHSQARFFGCCFPAETMLPQNDIDQNRQRLQNSEPDNVTDGRIFVSRLHPSLLFECF
jgi:hypothetical protein